MSPILSFGTADFLGLLDWEKTVGDFNEWAGKTIDNGEAAVLKSCMTSTLDRGVSLILLYRYLGFVGGSFSHF